MCGGRERERERERGGGVQGCSYRENVYQIVVLILLDFLSLYLWRCASQGIPGMKYWVCVVANQI